MDILKQVFGSFRELLKFGEYTPRERFWTAVMMLEFVLYAFWTAGCVHVLFTTPQEGAVLNSLLGLDASVWVVVQLLYAFVLYSQGFFLANSAKKEPSSVRILAMVLGQVFAIAVVGCVAFLLKSAWIAAVLGAAGGVKLIVFVVMFRRSRTT